MILYFIAGFIAGFIYALFVKDMRFNNIAALTHDDWKEFMQQAFEFAQCCAKSPDNGITTEFARDKAQFLPQHQ